MAKGNRKSVRARAAIFRASFIEPLERRVMLTSTISAIQGVNYDAGELYGTGNVYVPAGANVTLNSMFRRYPALIIDSETPAG